MENGNKIDFVSMRKTTYILSAVLVAFAFFAIGFWGFKLGIDFTGGSLLEIEYESQRPSVEILEERISSADFGVVHIQPTSDQGYLIRLRDLSEEEHQRLLWVISDAGSETFEEKRFDSIGPTIGKELRRRAIVALIVVLVLIIFYIAWAFRKVSRPVSSWKYGIAAIVALFHDVAIPAGIFAALGHFKGIEIDSLFVTALLTVLGFSVHDTIVVFDRIRENLKKHVSDDFGEVVNVSVRETVTRSINTSLTVIFVLGALLMFGGESTKYFSLALLIGVFFGTYSSIFLASPLLVSWERWRQRRALGR